MHPAKTGPTPAENEATDKGMAAQARKHSQQPMAALDGAFAEPTKALAFQPQRHRDGRGRGCVLWLAVAGRPDTCIGGGCRAAQSESSDGGGEHTRDQPCDIRAGLLRRLPTRQSGAGRARGIGPPSQSRAGRRHIDRRPRA